MFTALASFFLDIRGHLWKERMLILGIALALSAVGVLFVHSTSAVEAESFPSAEALKQTIWVAAGLGLLFAMVCLSWRTLERLVYVLYFLVVALLAALLVAKWIAQESIGRWISLGIFNFQPSELMKAALVLALARYLRFRSDQRRLNGLVKPFLLTLAPMLLVVAQPDLGTALMLPPILLGLLLVAGARRSHLAWAVCAGLLLFPAMVLLHTYLPQVSRKIVKEYQVRRLTAFIQRDQMTRLSDGYQLDQSVIAFGSGGLWGKGYMEGTQNRLRFLPAKHTDFIFAIIGEEWGFAGTSAVALLYLILVLLCFQVAVRTREPFARLAVTGIGILFAAQGAENLSMTLGLTPITGIPLPFISYGGSSMVTSFLSVGVVLGIAFRPVRVVASQDLNPQDEEKVLYVVDETPAGANPFPQQ